MIPPSLDDMTAAERSLLLYLETRAVDYGGPVDMRHMNADDRAIAERWNESCFIEFGRIKFEDIKGYATHWCQLSPAAWNLAHKERLARFERQYKRRQWRKTSEE